MPCGDMLLSTFDGVCWMDYEEGLGAGCMTCMREFIAGRIVRNPPGEFMSSNRIDGIGLLVLLPWRTKSFNMRWSRS